MSSFGWKVLPRIMMTAGVIASVLALSACSSDTGSSGSDPTAEDDDNPFLDANKGPEGKADTGWISHINAPEVEVTMEGDIDLSSRWHATNAPVDLAQFALTNLRKNSNIYIESLISVPQSDRTIEWKVDGSWIPESDISSVSVDKLNHFRIKNVNAIVLRPKESETLKGKVYEAVVPTTPYKLFTNYKNACSRGDHGDLWDSDYWYTWAPDKSGCEAPTRKMSVTIDKVFNAGVVRYPEYDKLLEDKLVSAVVFFGKVGHEDNTPIEDDFGYKSMNSFIYKLTQAGFAASTSPDGLRRYTKVVDGITEVVDISSPEDFEGLMDNQHASTFKKAVKSHEVVIYNGHSVLGASPMWNDMNLYPDGYQIYYFNGCLGYEYYIKFILEGKKSWANVDVISNIVETPVAPQANVIAAFIAGLYDGATSGGHNSWQQIMGQVNRRTYNSYYGVSGARDNCFAPGGSLCESTVQGNVYDNKTPANIPDNDPTGVTSTIDVPDSATIDSLSVKVDIQHTWVGDLTITLSHGGKTVTLWDRQGGHDQDMHQIFKPNDFKGMDGKGAWELKIVDSANRDEGKLLSWSVEVVPSPN